MSIIRPFAIAILLLASSNLIAQDDFQEAPDPPPDAAYSSEIAAAEIGPLAKWLSPKLEADAPGDDELQKLLKARYRAAQAELSWNLEVCAQGVRSGGDTLLEGTQRAVAHLTKSALALSRTRAEKIAILQQQLKVRQHLEEMVTASYEAGLGPSQGYHQARYLRLSAEVDLRKLEREAKGK